MQVRHVFFLGGGGHRGKPKNRLAGAVDDYRACCGVWCGAVQCGGAQYLIMRCGRRVGYLATTGRSVTATHLVLDCSCWLGCVPYNIDQDVLLQVANLESLEIEVVFMMTCNGNRFAQIKANRIMAVEIKPGKRPKV